jgi:serine/threonine-protein kinase RIM15
MREEREELKEAAEQTLNVIVDLDLDGRIKWVSPSWRQVVGTSPESLEGRMISDFLVDNKTAFHDAIESMKEDDSRSRFIRFGVRMGPESILKYSPEPRPVHTVTEESSVDSQPSKEVDNHDVLSMEGQGIMVFERTPDGTGHVGFHSSRQRVNPQNDRLTKL